MAYNSEVARPMSLAIIRNSKGQILVSPGYDKVKKESFFRLLGGGIEFGETSLIALRREFKEELDVELTACKLLGVVENIFSFDGLTCHEIIFVYEASFLDTSNYNIREFSILEADSESKDQFKAIWLDPKEFSSSIIYPDVSSWL